MTIILILLAIAAAIWVGYMTIVSICDVSKFILSGIIKLAHKYRDEDRDFVPPLKVELWRDRYYKAAAKEINDKALAEYRERRNAQKKHWLKSSILWPLARPFHGKSA